MIYKLRFDILPAKVVNISDMCKKNRQMGDFFGEAEKWKRKKGSGDDNRDNNSYLAFAQTIITVAPTLCHGKEYDATKILHYQNCSILYKITQNYLLGTAIVFKIIVVNRVVNYCQFEGPRKFAICAGEECLVDIR